MKLRIRGWWVAAALIALYLVMTSASMDGCNELRAVRIGADGPQSHRCVL